MRVLLTGANGTVGTEMVNYLQSINSEIFKWNRKEVSPFNYNEMKSFIVRVNPDILFHFASASESTGIENESWRINYEWTSELAWITKILGIKFLFTSSVMVFSDNARGPFTPESVPDASEGYGFEKRKAEERVLYQNENAYIARLGWQIGDKFTGNNMLAWFETEMKNKGIIKASNKWYPACSFMKDTVKELYRIVTEEKPGLYLIDSNQDSTFYEIASSLNKRYGSRWNIVKDDTFIFDQRMTDLRTKIEKLKAYE